MMADMRFQFSTRVILLVVAIVAIGCGSIITFNKQFWSARGWQWSDMGYLAIYGLIFWLPAIFVAYAIGRRRLTVSLVVLLALAELVTLFGLWLIVWS